MSSTTDTLSGKTKQVVGKITNNKELETKGKVEQAKGKVKRSLRRTEDKLVTKIDEVK